MTSVAYAPAAGAVQSRGTMEFCLGVLTYSTYLLGSFSPSVRGLTLVPIVALAAMLALQPHRFRSPLPLLLFGVGFLTVYLASWAFSGKTDYGNFKLTMLWLKFVPLLFIPCFIRDRATAFFSGVAAVLVFFLLIASARSVGQIGVISINDRLEFGVFNPIWIARAAFECVLISMVILRHDRRRVLAILAMALVVAYVAGSKGPILSFVVATLYWRFADRNTLLAKRIALVLVVAGLAAGGVILSRSADAQSYLVQRFLRAIPEGSSERVIDESRLIVWPATVAKLGDEGAAKILVGQGVGNFGTLYFGQPVSDRVYPHNLVMELVVEQGLLVGVAVLMFLAWILRRYRNAFRTLLVYYFINAMFSGDLPLNEYVFFYIGWVMVAGRELAFPRHAPQERIPPAAPVAGAASAV